MEKLKDIVLIGFAVVGFISILSGFTEQQVYGTPESHQWEFSEVIKYGQTEHILTLNKATGEVRRYTSLEKIDKAAPYYYRVYKSGME